MNVELTKDQIRTIKDSLRYSMDRINNYEHQSYEIKKTSLLPVEDALRALPDLRKSKGAK